MVLVYSWGSLFWGSHYSPFYVRQSAQLLAPSSRLFGCKKAKPGIHGSHEAPETMGLLVLAVHAFWDSLCQGLGFLWVWVWYLGPQSWERCAPKDFFNGAHMRDLMFKRIELAQLLVCVYIRDLKV